MLFARAESALHFLNPTILLQQVMGSNDETRRNCVNHTRRHYHE